MPLIRCPRCAQAYDVPGAVAVRLPGAIATCHCGEWLSGSRAALLARMMTADEIREIDLQPYRVDGSSVATPSQSAAGNVAAAARARSVRLIARGARTSMNTIFTIRDHPLWIGRKGCHVDLEESDLSIRHCSITVQGDELVVRDAESHMGTYLDGQPISEAVIGDGVHLLRAGSALVSVEPTEEEGTIVGPIALDPAALVDESKLAEKMRARQDEDHGSRTVLLCTHGSLEGQEFEMPPTGLVVGREGHVRVPDEFLSRRHFEIVRDPDGSIRVRDLGSRNGTFLNTLPARNTRVRPGDEIRAGENTFRVERRK